MNKQYAGMAAKCFKENLEALEAKTKARAKTEEQVEKWNLYQGLLNLALAVEELR